MTKCILFLFYIVNGYKFNWYYNNNIHNFGNIGLGGKFHAFCSPYSSKIIDKIAYKGENVRLNSLLSCPCKDSIKDILDIGCGTGASTIAVKQAFPQSNVIGMDCSTSMLNNCQKDDITYMKDYAHQSSLMGESFDMINSMFLFHEAPREGRIALLNECYRLLKPGGYLNIMDIRLNYEPNIFMSAGEPYLDDYLCFFRTDIQNSPFLSVKKKSQSDVRLDILLQKPK